MVIFVLVSFGFELFFVSFGDVLSVVLDLFGRDFSYE